MKPNRTFRRTYFFHVWKNKINFCQESFFFVRKMKNLTFHTKKKISAWTFDSPSNTFPSFLTKMLLPWNINNGTTFFLWSLYSWKEIRNLFTSFQVQSFHFTHEEQVFSPEMFFFYSTLHTEKNQEFMKIILFVSTGASEDIFFLSGQFSQFDLNSFLSCV